MENNTAATQTPEGKYTIAEAAEAWIEIIQAPTAKATQEQKDALIAQIRTAAPSAKAFGVGYPNGMPAGYKMSFVTATNAIKQVIRGER